jgi:TupA-like ATPgrasp
MGWLSDLEYAALPLRKMIAQATRPYAARPGHPLFSERIMDRRRRWHFERQPNSYAAVSSKVDGRAYMQSLGYAVPKVYGVYPSLDEIPKFDALPGAFVLKPNGGWSRAGVFLMCDGVDLLRKRSFTRDELVQTVRSFEDSGKMAIKGPWIAEEMLFQFDSRREAAMDYKFFCFGPKVAMIQVNQRTGKEFPFYRHWVKDPDWNPVDFRIRWDYILDRAPLARPPFLDEMLRIASDVGGRLNVFVRIDMYATDHGPVFGEFTAYPHAGKDYTPQADAWLGSLWKTLDGGD